MDQVGLQQCSTRGKAILFGLVALLMANGAWLLASAGLPPVIRAGGLVQVRGRAKRWRRTRRSGRRGHGSVAGQAMAASCPCCLPSTPPCACHLPHLQILLGTALGGICYRGGIIQVGLGGVSMDGWVEWGGRRTQPRQRRGARSCACFPCLTGCCPTCCPPHLQDDNEDRPEVESPTEQAAAGGSSAAPAPSSA
jgi:hypothetical protein